MNGCEDDTLNEIENLMEPAANSNDQVFRRGEIQLDLLM